MEKGYNLNFWYLLVEVLIFTHKSGCSQSQKVGIMGFFLRISEQIDVCVLRICSSK